MLIKSYERLKLEKLQFLGSGTQGKVYRIDSSKCIKIFKSRQVCRDELKTLMMAQKDPHFPRVYAAGENYIIRECINGMELNKYLSMYPLTPFISDKIIKLYEAMSKVGYSRLDAAIFHIFITPQGDLRLIDTSKAIRKKTIYPGLIINGLEEVGYKEEFIDFVESIRPELYMKWKKYLK